jgi:hypothetical protein
VPFIVQEVIYFVSLSVKSWHLMTY